MDSVAQEIQSLPASSDSKWDSLALIRATRRVQEEHLRRYNVMTGQSFGNLKQAFWDDYRSRLSSLSQVGVSEKRIERFHYKPSLLGKWDRTRGEEKTDGRFGVVSNSDGTYRCIDIPPAPSYEDEPDLTDAVEFKAAHDDQWEIFLSTLQYDPLAERRHESKRPGPSDQSRWALEEIGSRYSGELLESWDNEHLENPAHLRYPLACARLWDAYHKFNFKHYDESKSEALIHLHRDYLVDAAKQCSVSPEFSNGRLVTREAVDSHEIGFKGWDQVLECFHACEPDKTGRLAFRPLKSRTNLPPPTIPDWTLNGSQPYKRTDR